MYPRTPPPGHPPQHPCFGGRSLILRSLCPGGSGLGAHNLFYRKLLCAIFVCSAGFVCMRQRVSGVPEGLHTYFTGPFCVHVILFISLLRFWSFACLCHDPCMRMDHANSTRRTGRRHSLFHGMFLFIECSIPPTLLMVKFHNR